MKAHPSTWCGVSRPRTLQSFRGLLRRMVSSSSLLAGLVVLSMATLPARAQPAATSTVTGRVLDNATGNFLEGADVQLQGTARHVTTARGGSFEIAGVPEGEHELIVNYIGLAAKTVPVTVTAGPMTPIIVSLNSDVVQMSTYQVSGVKEGTFPRRCTI